MSKRLDYKEGTPLYVEITKRLRDEITHGLFAGVDKMPSETELAQVYRVSRNTIREALSVLETEGFLVRKHGVGTFVSDKRFSPGSNEARDLCFTGIMRKLGKISGTLKLNFDWEPSDVDMSDILRIPVGSVLGVLKRIRTADNQPILYAIDKIPEDVIGQDFRPEEMGESFFVYLFKKRGVVLARSNISVRATAPNRVIANMLDMDPALPLLRVEETYFSPDSLPVLWSANYYRSDAYMFNITSLLI